jgi:hypothetical protein
MPPSLEGALGEPPPLSRAFRPLRYTVVFDPTDARCRSCTPIRCRSRAGRRYPYFRSANGVVRYGRPLRDYAGAEKRRIEAVFARAGRDAFERNVLQAVSRFEGGFEAVITYDTGYVSVGFIQFITGVDGNGSLASVLIRHRPTSPVISQAIFRRFGVDVASEGVLVVLDPATGRELRGEAAVQAVIDDKRLTAVFERAGYRDGFRLAQGARRPRPLLARRRRGERPHHHRLRADWRPGRSGPAGDRLRRRGHGGAGPYAEARQAERRRTDPGYRSWGRDPHGFGARADIVRSEAGMATLMDRKVNRGNIRNITEVAADIMRANKLTRIETLIYHEKALIQGMKHRGDFLSIPHFTQPRG